MMSKRNISYIKPQDPSFLAKLKAQIGYKEAPTIEAKRPRLQEDNGDSDSFETEVEQPEREDEQPQVVVLHEGDLTAEQVDHEKRRIAKEKSEAPADLDQRIIFRRKVKADNHLGNTITNNNSNNDRKDAIKRANKEKRKAPGLASSQLSFNVDDEEEEEN